MSTDSGQPDGPGLAGPVSVPASIAGDATEYQRRATRQLLVARIVFFGCSYVGSVVLARTLGATAFGTYGVIMSLLLWVEMVVNAGIPSAAAKLMADGRHDPVQVEGAARGLLLGTSMLLLAVCWIAAPAVAALMGILDGHLLLRLAVLDLPFAGVYAAYEGILNGYRRFGVVAAMHTALGLSRLAGVLALLALGVSVDRVLIANVLAAGVVCAALFARLPPSGLRTPTRTIADMAAIAAPMAVYLISGQVLVNLDLWTLQSVWQGDGDVMGHYVAAANLARSLMLIPAVQAGVVFASVAWALSSRDTTRARLHVREASRFAIIVAVGTVVVLGMNARAVLSLLYSAEYAAGARYFQWLVVGFGLFALVDLFARALQAAGTPWRLAAVLVPMIPLLLACNVVMIRWLGPIGAAISMVMGLSACALITGLMLRDRLGSPIPAATVGRVGVAAAAVGLVSVVVPATGALLLAKLGLLGSVYLGVLYVQGEITARDLGLVASRGAR